MFGQDCELWFLGDGPAEHGDAVVQYRCFNIQVRTITARIIGNVAVFVPARVADCVLTQAIYVRCNVSDGLLHSAPYIDNG